MITKLSKMIISALNRLDASLNRQRMSRSPQRNLHNILWERAAAQSADFVQQYLGSVMIFREKTDMWNYASTVIGENSKHGLCMEFGVAGGTSINWISNLLPNHTFIGFDSFTGLKEDWVGHHATMGAYSQNGVLPSVNNNVSLVRGWFNETLPKYIDENDIANLKFVHIDGDTYEAAVAVFDELGKHLKQGTFILFDELIGYPNWQNGEYKALQEAQKQYGFKFQYRAFSSQQALIEIVEC